MSEELEKPKRGFAGLNSMVSVVDVPEPPEEIPAPSADETTTQKRGSPLGFSMPAVVPEEPFWNKAWVKWTFWIFILIVIIAAFGNKKETAPTITSSSNSGYTPTYTPTYEELPPIGSGLTLTNDQIRYCLSEKIRIEAWETAVNTYSDTSVDTFNNAIENFNMRCSSYRYKKYAMETVSSQVEARRSELHAEGLRKAALYSGR